MKTLIIIPARWESTRLPGKPLAMIGDKPMIQHTWERACESNADEVIIACDSKIVYDAATKFGAKVIWTPAADTGTERVIGVQEIEAADFVINVQGDEPFINPKDINEVIKIVHNHPDKVATLRTDLIGNEGKDPNVVKAISNAIGLVGMFTRSSIYMRTNFAYKHIGIYGYSSKVLNKISSLEPTESSVKDSLEQLTWMDNNIPIIASWTSYKSLGVDTKEDLKNANDFYKTISDKSI
jgi:3-deoxy-manno-octulosonate cytidylyltransferase (CMP-KDO synthetase)|tara:strand:- start:477 stop:1193 length:717 start_codon:yes stop_codon:yes gene_type:complete